MNNHIEYLTELLLQLQDESESRFQEEILLLTKRIESVLDRLGEGQERWSGPRVAKREEILQ
jgi:hypothetical protein